MLPFIFNSLFTFHCEGVYISLIEGSLSPKKYFTNEAIKNNMDELKGAIRGQNVEIANLREKLNEAMKQSADAERDLTVTRKIVDQQQEEITELYGLLDHLEQYTSKTPWRYMESSKKHNL